MKNSYNFKGGRSCSKLLAGAACAICLFLSGWNNRANGQVYNATFEKLGLPADSFWNGKDNSGGFMDDHVYFYNSYNSGGWWSGFAYSSKTDTTTAGYSNQYSAYPGGGAEGSSTYAIGNGAEGTGLKVTDWPEGMYIEGFDVANTTYAALSMKHGDQFAKKFGGVSGDDPDWFLLRVVGYYKGEARPDTVKIYLADFRFEDNSQDFILDTWKHVELFELGLVDSLSFLLSSSDTGDWGMNTPAYFALDNFWSVGPDNVRKSVPAFDFRLFPNPAVTTVEVTPAKQVSGDLHIQITDTQGKELYETTVWGTERIQVPVEALPAGLYLLTVSDGEAVSSTRFVKW